MLLQVNCKRSNNKYNIRRGGWIMSVTMVTGIVWFLSTYACFVCSCLVYYPFHQSFCPQLWTFLNVLLKKLRGTQHLKDQNHKIQMLRYSEIKRKSLIQHPAHSPILLYLVLAHLAVIMNTLQQTCLKDEEPTFQKLNFRDVTVGIRIGYVPVTVLQQISFVLLYNVTLPFY